MAKNRLKSVAGIVHLWAGLLTGIVVCIVSITGSLYVFEEELFKVFHSELFHITPLKQPLKLSELRVVAAQSVAGKPINSVKILGDPSEPFVFTAQKAVPPEKVGITYFSQVEYWEEIYVDPYRGKVLGVVDRKHEFFNVDRQLHQHLLLSKPIGSVIVGSSILIYLLMMITGLILWFPHQMKNLKSRLTIKWGAHWKRVNHDLHNTLGFYALPLLIFIACTGLVWSFKWWELGIYKLMGTDKKPAFGREYKLPSTKKPEFPAEDVVLAQIHGFVKGNYKTIGITFVDKPDKPLNTYVLLKNNTDGWRGFSYFFFDSQTGEFFDRIDHQSKPLPMKWRNSNLDLHTGRLYGWPTQVLFVFLSLISASLPVTGFLIWWGKRKKKSGKTRSKKSARTGLQKVSVPKSEF